MKKNSKSYLAINLPMGSSGQSLKSPEEIMPLLSKVNTSEVDLCRSTIRSSHSLKIPVHDSLGLLKSRAAQIRQLAADKNFNEATNKRTESLKENGVLKEAVARANAEADSIKKNLKKFGQLFRKLHESLQDRRSDTAKYVSLIRNELGISNTLFDFEKVQKKHKREPSFNRGIRSPYFSPTLQVQGKPVRKFNSSITLRTHLKQKTNENPLKQLEMIKYRLRFTIEKLRKKTQ